MSEDRDARSAPGSPLNPQPEYIDDRELAKRLGMTTYRLRGLARKAGCGRVVGARIIFNAADVRTIWDSLPRPGAGAAQGRTHALPASRSAEYWYRRAVELTEGKSHRPKRGVRKPGS